MNVGSFSLEQQKRDVGNILRLPLEERKKRKVVLTDPETVLAADHAATKYHNKTLKDFRKTITSTPFELTYSILDEFSGALGKGLVLREPYQTSERFLNALHDQHALLVRANTAIRDLGKGHPKVKALLKQAQDSNSFLRRTYPKQISQLPSDVRKQVKSLSRSLKNARKGRCPNKLEVPRNIGSKYMSFETMNTIIKGANVVNKAIFGLGALACGIEVLNAYEADKDFIRPIPKWIGGLAAAYGTAHLVGEAAIYCLPLGLSAFTGISPGVLALFLTSTPWGWVTIGVIVGVASFFGCSYGEQWATKAYDSIKPYVKKAWTTTTEVYDAALNIVDASWKEICDYAQGLFVHYIESKPKGITH